MKPTRLRLLIFSTAFCFFAIFLPSAQFPSDTIYSIETAKSICSGKISINPSNVLPNLARGRDGNFYSKYGLGYSLFFLPAAVITKIVPAKNLKEYIYLGLNSFTNVIIAAIIIVLFVNILFKFGYDAGTVYLTSFSIAVASILLPYSKINHAEIPTTALILLFFYEFYGLQTLSLKKGILFGAIASFLLLLKIGNIIYFLSILGCGVYLIGKKKVSIPEVLSLCIIPVITIVLMFGFNYYRFSNPFNFGYGGEQKMFCTPVLKGMAGFFFSPSKSIFLFSPLVIPSIIGLFMVWKKMKVTAIAASVMITGNLLFYSGWHDWHGGWSWGPRLIVPSIILLHMFLPEFLTRAKNCLIARLAFNWLFIIAFLVNILGVSIWYQQIYYFHQDYTSIKNSHIVIATKLFFHKINHDDEIYDCSDYNCDCTGGYFKKLWGTMINGNTINFSSLETFRGFAFPWSVLRRNFGIKYLWLIPTILSLLSLYGVIRIRKTLRT